MTTTRFFKHISIQKKDQDTQYEGDIFELILGMARCSIQFSQAAGRVADFTEMLLDQSNEKELQCVRYTVVWIEFNMIHYYSLLCCLYVWRKNQFMFVLLYFIVCHKIHLLKSHPLFGSISVIPRKWMILSKLPYLSISFNY